MNVRELPRPQKRFKTPYNAELQIKKYGEDNLYPETIRGILQASPTGFACYSRFAHFLYGSGFAANGDMKVNANETLNDLLRLASADFSMFNGFALHVNYNIAAEITTIQHVPFEMVRMEESDDNGYISGYYVHQDWTGQATRNGKRFAVNRQNVKYFPRFDPKREVVWRQMRTAGGIEFFGGQILYFSANGVDTYPTPIYDSSANELSTEEGLGNVKLRNVRFNFLPSGVAVFQKSQMPPDDATGVDYADVLNALQGDTNVGKIMTVELENDEQKPEFVEYPVRNFDKDFSVTDTSVVERIYAAFSQEVFYCLRVGKVGFSGDVVADAYAYYASFCAGYQQLIAAQFSRLLSIWHGGAVDNLQIKRIEL